MKRRSGQRELHVRAGKLEDLGRDFIDTWQRAEQGRLPESSRDEVIFLDVATLVRVLTDKRLELLRKLQRHSGITTYELTKRLGRHYKNVHSDVALLRNCGLITEYAHKPGTLSVPYSRIHAEIDLAA